MLREFGDAKNILVINDEAHHCWRVTESKVKDEKATIWVEGLDKIHDSEESLGHMIFLQHHSDLLELEIKKKNFFHGL